jgi:hypothetical protein
VKRGYLLGAVEPDDDEDLVNKSDGEERELDAPISGEHAHDSDGEVDDDSDGVFDAEGVDVGRALEAGVEDVGHGDGGEKAEEPFSAREEVLLVA